MKPENEVVCFVVSGASHEKHDNVQRENSWRLVVLFAANNLELLNSEQATNRENEHEADNHDFIRVDLRNSWREELLERTLNFERRREEGREPNNSRRLIAEGTKNIELRTSNFERRRMKRKLMSDG